MGSAETVTTAIGFEETLAAFESGSGAAILERLGSTLATGATDPRLWHIHGLILRQLDRREDAIPSLQRAAQLAPTSARIAHALARTYSEAGLPSLEAYGRALRLAPSDVELIAGMTEACAAEGQADAAISGIDSLVSRSPEWIDGHKLLSRLRWAHGDRAHFARSFEAAVAVQPQNIDLWREWLIALVHAEQWGEAARVVGLGRAAIGDHPVFAVHEAIIAAETGDCERAEALFLPFAEIDDATVQLRRVRHYLRSGDPQKAAEIAAAWLQRPESFMFLPYASVAWRLLDDSRWEWLEGDESFVGVYDIADRLPPLDRLGETLRNLHKRNAQPLEQSLRGGTQTDGHLFMHVDPVLVQLREALREIVAEHAGKLPAHMEGHPLLGCPRSPITFTGAWSVWLRKGGFHTPHVHPFGWFSSALYIELPPDLGEDEAGFLTLGDPSSETLKIDMAPIRTVEPKPGRLVLFPSYMWHGTKPFAEGDRLTLAFDVAVPGPM